MVDSFEKFLKKHSHKQKKGISKYKDAGEATAWSFGIDDEFEEFKKDLGEWACNKAYTQKWELLDDRFYVYREIACACLGKAEVNKRIKVLNQVCRKEKLKAGEQK